MKLEELHKAVKKWLYLKNVNRLDLMLAIHLTRLLKGTKLWCVFIGGSGGAKSELLRALENEEETITLQEFTPNTLVSGNPMAQDLAPQLDNKTILIMDMAILLNLKKDDKAKVWAQLRELFDGNAGKFTGSGKREGKKYSGLNITLLANSTGAFDEQILIHQSLGTREFLYRINPVEEEKERNELMKKVLENEAYEELMRQEIKKAVQEFLIGKKYREIEIKKETEQKIKDYVNYICVMRATPSMDSYSGEVIATTEPESPTRILKQFVRLYRALKSLSEDYTEEKALEILKEVRDSSCNQDRIKIMKIIAEYPKQIWTISQISEQIRLGKSTVTRHLNALWNLKLINRQVKDLGFGKEIYTWYANETNNITRLVMKEVEDENKPKEENV